MNTYETNVAIVLKKLNEVEYEQRVRDYHLRTYHEFRQYLEERDAEYSTDLAHVWLRLSRKVCTPPIYQERFRSIKKLVDVFELGYIRPPLLSHEKITVLPSLENWLDQFLAQNKNNYTGSSCRDYRMYCRRFLRFLQSRGIADLSQLSYPLLGEYADLLPDGDTGLSMTGVFLKFLSDEGCCTAGLYWYFHYYREKWLLCPGDLPSEQHALIEAFRSENRMLPLIQYQEALERYLEGLEEKGYQSTILLHSRRALRLLLVFLEMGNLGYHKAVADLWYKSNEPNLGCAKHMIKRTLAMFGDYVETGLLRTSHVYRSVSPKTAPEWGKDALDAFILQKKKEKHARTSVSFYRNACIRFLAFLDLNGVRSYAEITQPHIFQFNISDSHKTSYSKNAYACRIRKFLRFLEREKRLSVAGLYLSLMPASSSGERIVITLTEEEKEKISVYVQNARTPIQLRDSAILLLGKDMGIRACDIAKLTFGDIDWKNRLIRFNQDKTDTDLCLPMPIQVGNAIFAYLKSGRPGLAKTDSIFVQSKAPYGPLNKGACRDALERALPGRKVAGSGFHVMRKTFSTDMLRGGADPSSIADALGHSTNDTVSKYLGLDEQKMALCPLSLSEAGIPAKGGE
ncbi:tyrosine-type recombinase/integrase [Schaedlerella sp.]|uniref:tyrosine-type recombinase/integrase n=1 Tax=Schaedlerella sp. TaxID=2676057 RepID=UPI003745A829